MLPRIILHNAVSADGRIDAFMPDIGLFYSLVSRWKEDATLAGSETILAADPDVPPETPADFNPPAADSNDTRPILVIPDCRGRVRKWHFLRKQPYWRDFIALVSDSTPADYLDYLEKRQIKFIRAGKERADLKRALEVLHDEHGVKTIRADSGGTLNGALLRAGLVDEISLLVHPVFVGGLSPKSVFRAADLAPEGPAINLKLDHFEKRPNDILWIIYKVVK